MARPARGQDVLELVQGLLAKATEADEFEWQLLHSLKRLEDHPEITKSIAGWPWIVNAIPIQK